jgi:hypothetical protein
MKFKGVVQTEEAPRALMGEPVEPPVVEKALSSPDKHCHKSISWSSFALIA